MHNLNCTRMELLAHKAQIELAKQGRDLLEQKHSALMKEVMRIAGSLVERSGELQQAAATARQALARAEAIAGVQAVQSAALASRAELQLEISSANVMGVRIPHIEQRQVRRSPLGRGYGIAGTSLTIDEAAAAFEVEVETMLQLAEDELCLRRLAGEIQRTTRRMNALDHLLIPRLEAERDFILTALDEQERSDHFRLKLVKRGLERKRGQRLENRIS